MDGIHRALIGFRRFQVHPVGYPPSGDVDRSCSACSFSACCLSRAARFLSSYSLVVFLIRRCGGIPIVQCAWAKSGADSVPVVYNCGEKMSMFLLLIHDLTIRSLAFSEEAAYGAEWLVVTSTSKPAFLMATNARSKACTKSSSPLVDSTSKQIPW
eukprot:scaffold47194_cov58-Phaeocystis_antarctica.AAC.2